MQTAARAGRLSTEHQLSKSLNLIEIWPPPGAERLRRCSVGLGLDEQVGNVCLERAGKPLKHVNARVELLALNPADVGSIYISVDRKRFL